MASKFIPWIIAAAIITTINSSNVLPGISWEWGIWILFYFLFIDRSGIKQHLNIDKFKKILDSLVNNKNTKKAFKIYFIIAGMTLASNDLMFKLLESGIWNIFVISIIGIVFFKVIVNHNNKITPNSSNE